MSIHKNACGSIKGAGCLLILLAPLLVYIFVRIVPAKVYMPWFFLSDLVESDMVVQENVICANLTHYKCFSDYSQGIYALFDRGPIVTWEGQEVFVVFQVTEDLSVRVVDSRTTAPLHSMRGISIVTNVAYAAYADFEDSAVLVNSKGSVMRRFKGEKGVRPDLQLQNGNMLVWKGIPGSSSVRLLRPSAEDIVWRGVTDQMEAFGASTRCYVPRTLYIRNRNENGEHSGTGITLFTFECDGSISTNTYNFARNCDGALTILGRANDAIFAESEWVSQEPVGRGRPFIQRRIIVWNRQGLIREVLMKEGEKPHYYVGYYEDKEHKYLVTLWAKSACKTSIEIRVTFVNLDSGEQVARDVVVSVPPI